MKTIFEMADEEARGCRMGSVTDERCEDRMDKQERSLGREIGQLREAQMAIGREVRGKPGWRTVSILVGIFLAVVGACYAISGAALARTASTSERVATLEAQHQEVLRRLDRLDAGMQELLRESRQRNGGGRG